MIWLQIGSPYLNDANELINLANQMGLIDEMLQRSTPKASKCLTRTAAEENNINQNRKRVLEIKDTYGMLTILSIGLGVALLIFLAENIVYSIYSKKGGKDTGRSKQANTKRSESIELPPRGSGWRQQSWRRGTEPPPR